jgi:hypothetical protein
LQLVQDYELTPDMFSTRETNGRFKATPGFHISWCKMMLDDAGYSSPIHGNLNIQHHPSPLLKIYYWDIGDVFGSFHPSPILNIQGFPRAVGPNKPIHMLSALRRGKSR